MIEVTFKDWKDVNECINMTEAEAYMIYVYWCGRNGFTPEVLFKED